MAVKLIPSAYGAIALVGKYGEDHMITAYTVSVLQLDREWVRSLPGETGQDFSSLSVPRLS